MRITLALAFAVVLLALPQACTNTIVPPASPADPVAVFLLDHGRTPSLVVPTDDGGMVRYAYGDWDYYALRQNDLWHGTLALFWPTQGALGRMELPGPPTSEAVRAQAGVGIEHLYRIEVERGAARQLQQHLDDIFHQHLDTLVCNEPYRLDFVHHPKRYTYLWNSNHAVANWLEQMGVRVRGLAFASKWRVAPNSASDG